MCARRDTHEFMYFLEQALLTNIYRTRCMTYEEKKILPFKT